MCMVNAFFNNTLCLSSLSLFGFSVLTTYYLYCLYYIITLLCSLAPYHNNKNSPVMSTPMDNPKTGTINLDKSRTFAALGKSVIKLLMLD